MAIEAEISIFYSGGAENNIPARSLGGDPSDYTVPPVIENIFGNLESGETIDGITDYRMIYVSNVGNAAINSLYTYLINELNTPAQIALGYFLANDLQRFTFQSRPSSGTITFTYTDIFGNKFVLNPISFTNPQELATNLATQLNLITDNFGQQILGGVKAVATDTPVGFILDVSFEGESGNKYQNLLTQTNTLGVTVNSTKSVNGSPINTVPNPVGVSTDKPASVAFFTGNPNNPIFIGKLLNNPYRDGEGEYLPIWIQRTVPADSLPQEVAGATLKITGQVYPPVPTPTPTLSASPTTTPGATPSPTPSPTSSPTESPTPTSTEASPTPTPSSSPTPSPSPSPSESPTPLPTDVATFTPTASPSFSPTVTPSPTPSPSRSPSPTPSPSVSATPTPTPSSSRPPNSAWVWGTQQNFQLGNGINTTGIGVGMSSPIQVGASYNIIDLALGKTSNCGAAITLSNQLLVWGENSRGQLGNGNTINQPTPALVAPANWITNGFSLSMGSEHSLAIRSDGSLWSWGLNSQGALGNSKTVNSSSPVQIGARTNWYAVSCGAYSSYAILNTAALYGWGYNSNGQLGTGNIINYSSPVQISIAGQTWALPSRGLNTFSARYHCLAVTTNFNLYAWGTNWNGCLGIGSTRNYSAPVLVGTTYAYVSAGLYHSAAIKTDNTLWIWGGNSYGQLGLGNTIPVSSPTQIPGSWSNVACGSYNTLAQKRDGTLWCCGYNYNGEVGNNSLANLKYSSMVQVATSAVNWGILVGGNQAMGAN